MTTVHLRFCRLPTPRDPCLNGALSDLLSPAERARCARLPGPQAAGAVVARALVRCEVAAVLGVDPRHLSFAAGPHGKPVVLDPQRPIAFNLSHSGDWMVLAWHTAPGMASVGVDLEHRTRGERDVMRLARRYFGAAEQSALLDLEGDARETLFYRLWTLKEAWVKAHGLALAPQLKAVVFDLRGDRLAVSNATAHETGQLLHGAVADGVWASLCVLGSATRLPALDARVGWPLADWSPLSLQGWCGTRPGT